jgi:hypothetical protein
LEEVLPASAKSVRTLSPQRKKETVLRLFFVRLLVLGLAASLVILGTLSGNQPQVTALEASPAIALVSSDDEPPLNDCLSMAALVLGGLGVRAGAAVYAVGNGAAYSNASVALGTILDFNSSVNCVSWVVPRYIDQVCEQSRQGLKYRKTWEARALVALATGGKYNRC